MHYEHYCQGTITLVCIVFFFFFNLTSGVLSFYISILKFYFHNFLVIVERERDQTTKKD